jgi:alginate O-acetyltransferase complex protein AlgI
MALSASLARRSTRRPAEGRWRAWPPLVALPAAAALAGPALPAWAWMWALAGAVFVGFKWLTWWRAGRRDPGRSLAYLVLWPGMDAPRFMDPSARPARPGPGEWPAALAKTAAGAILLWGVARTVPRGAAGWAGMVGLVLVLHFGLFHVLSLLWRTAGIDARPLMRAPLRATSLADFWSERWNRAFVDLARPLVLRPLHRPLGLAGATFAVFLASGLVHELVISVPAGGGWGLPAGYFALQGVGVLVERSAAGRRLGLGAGGRGWLFTLALVAGPVYWLFHPAFVERVVLPMLRALGAL